MQFAAVIFDMDGLLVDSERIWLIAETAMIEERGHHYTEDVREQIVGMRMDDFMVKLRDIYQFEDSIENLNKDLMQRMLQLIPEQVVEQPGASEIVRYVANNGYPLAIASSSSMPIIDATIKSQAWESLILHRYSAEEVVNGKPAPDVYLLAAEKLKVDPTQCLALEDSPNGARAAVAAGMTCYAVPDPSHTSPEAFAGITDNVFPDLHAVLSSLQSHS